MAQPASLTTSLFPRIVESYHSGKVADFTLCRYEEDARKIMQSNRYDGEMVMGLIEGLRHNLEGVRAHYRAATALRDEFITHHNFINAFANAYDYRAAREAVVASIRTMDPSNPSDVEDASSSAFLYGLVDEALRLQSDLRKLRGDRENTESIQAVEDLHALNIPDLPGILLLAYDEIAKHKLILFKATLNLSELYGEQYAEYVLTVNECPVEQLARCQEAVYQALTRYELEHNLPPLPFGIRLIRRQPE